MGIVYDFDMLVKTNYETKARVSELKFQGKKNK